MIQAYARSSQLHRALRMLARMLLEGVEATEATVTALLTGCGFGGEVDEARKHFLRMEDDFGVRPSLTHFHCLVDALGRGKKLDEAEELVETMPYLPDKVSWVSLLAACRMHGDGGRAKRAASRILELDSQNTAASILLEESTRVSAC
ncbi:hypothetical protein SELMODRAFT_96428 [Selaginella moellendorffii]|uniref:PROP1-like PPR domain-containing protein n=2 Tax=Selaginella moellendorffii TaxID=88036 RepID=D8RM68_SELML|nr:hypothetical protein SELMODRAFT_96428 [Selaginella moellendorffii]